MRVAWRVNTRPAGGAAAGSYAILKHVISRYDALRPQAHTIINSPRRICT